MRLFVGNLSFQTTEQAVRDAFSQVGTVNDCTLMMDRFTQQSRGFAFVTMGSAEEAEAAIRELDGKQIDGRALKVNEAKPREEGGGRNFNGGGRGGERGGERRSFSGQRR
jgi:RNA recognition motif-containing protein